MKPSSSNNYNYDKHLSSNAKELRESMTKVKPVCGNMYSGARSIKGFTFRRQRPVLQYIADFMCKELLLIIEVDGVARSMVCFLKTHNVTCTFHTVIKIPSFEAFERCL